jgi:hypothetical protein
MTWRPQNWAPVVARNSSEGRTKTRSGQQGRPTTTKSKAAARPNPRSEATAGKARTERIVVGASWIYRGEQKLKQGHKLRTKQSKTKSGQRSTTGVENKNGSWAEKWTTQNKIQKIDFSIKDQTWLQLWNTEVIALPPLFDYWNTSLNLGSLSLI